MMGTEAVVQLLQYNFLFLYMTQTQTQTYLFRQDCRKSKVSLIWAALLGGRKGGAGRKTGNSRRNKQRRKEMEEEKEKNKCRKNESRCQRTGIAKGELSIYF